MESKLADDSTPAVSRRNCLAVVSHPYHRLTVNSHLLLVVAAGTETGCMKLLVRSLRSTRKTAAGLDLRLLRLYGVVVVNYFELVRRYKAVQHLCQL